MKWKKVFSSHSIRLRLAFDREGVKCEQECFIERERKRKYESENDGDGMEILSTWRGPQMFVGVKALPRLKSPPQHLLGITSVGCFR